MRNDAKRKEALDTIRENIAQNGHHIYMVLGGPSPRFAYTIGVSEAIGTELILAGAYYYEGGEVAPIINNVARELKANGDRGAFEVSRHGTFTLRKVHTSWAKTLMLGALDYYQMPDMPALQILPEEAHWTIDVPDLSAPWSGTQEPIWRWLHEPWTYPVPDDSQTVTNLAALRGERITEVMRWEENEWEIFAGAGPDVPEEEMRKVPLGTLLAADPSLVPVVDLPIEEGLWRDPDPDSEWHPWRKRQPEADTIP